MRFKTGVMSHLGTDGTEYALSSGRFYSRNQTDNRPPGASGNFPPDCRPGPDW
jgi:hypothetical protein